MLVTAFGDGPFELGRNLIAFLAIALAAWLTREGLTAEEAYNSRTIARRPALPRKMLGSVMIGVGVGLATFTSGILSASLYGVIAAGLHLFSFGFDPLQDKGVEGADDFQSDRVVRAVDEAEKHLSAMHETIKKTGDRVM
ncbi:MAG: hypothetical protein HKP40_02660, partial [Litoreibacter sp.]|nr:hypothetical protein [Litoreibacter sp.]